MSGHSLHSCNCNDLYFSSELSINNETHNSGGTSVPSLSTHCSLSASGLMGGSCEESAELGAKKVDRVPDLTLNSCVTLCKSSSFNFKLLPWSVSTCRAVTLLFLLCRP